MMKKKLCMLALFTAVAATWGGWTSVDAQNRNQWYSLGDPHRLTGTYRLDRAQSDNLQQIANRMTASLRGAQRTNVERQLLEQLEPPAEISIDRNGTSVTIASSSGPQFTFDADGRDRTEQGGDYQMRTHADMYGDELTVTTSGARGRDFTVRFAPLQNGLRVTRQVDHQALQSPVTVHSVYRRTSDQPRWDVYRDDPSRNPSRNNDPWATAGGRGGRGGAGGAVIPDGVRLTARLDERLNARNLQNGEPFTLTVTGGQYRNAVITGRAGSTTERANRSDVLVDFDTIRLANGRTGEFAGRIESIRTPDGRVIEVGRGGAVQGDQSSSNTVQRGAIGAAIGGLIGALGWGTRGAVIGAVAGGAGMILVGDRDDASIPAGSELTIVSSRMNR